MRSEKVNSIRFFPQGRGAKKKDLDSIQIRVLLYVTSRDN